VHLFDRFLQCNPWSQQSSNLIQKVFGKESVDWFLTGFRSNFQLFHLTVHSSACSLDWSASTVSHLKPAMQSSTRHDKQTTVILNYSFLLYKGDPSDGVKEHSGEESQEQRMRRHGMVLTWLISQRQQTARAPEVSRANITSCHLAFCDCKTTVSSSWETLVASFRDTWFPLTWRWTSLLQENKINWENDSLLDIAVNLWCFLGIIFCL
jgi:hypothetical protein